MADRIIILGAGESGTGAALLADSKGFEVYLSDSGAIASKYKAKLDKANIHYEEGGHDYSKWVGAVLMVKSPGIPPQADPIKWCKKNNIPVIGEIEWGARFTNKPIIGITGTNGKTTTTLLTHHLVKSGGLNYALTGNVGKSFAEAVIENEKYDGYVIEVSSFQLDDIVEFKPKIAVLLNVTPDHLDRYDNSMELYLSSKMRIVANMDKNDHFIANISDEYTAKGVKEVKEKVNLITLGANDTDINIDVRENEINFNLDKRNFTVKSDDLPVKGPHNMINAGAAIAAAIKSGVSETDIRKGLDSFENAPHRLQLITEINGASYVNDSKATNVEAVYYALKSFDNPIIWIAGGVDKGNDYEMILPLVKEKVKALICMGTDNKKLVDAFGDHVRTFDTGSLKKAMAVAYAEARPGDIVLLSPACASFDLFKNYEDRGNQFIEAINNLKEEVSDD
ncbi:UDP-N-acetylmuramoyl-L-alanine--D-glutamate ligase [Mangrovivirga cuniculi]|uniref:UDP-N-acetylmuramoylalanine--D-glutamate ligase n=1 Tax=Mangrovivirga cuniculi TaxID=2715131 RepID=A0A4D7JRT0_9BACT|nr:UDP-N-acetylmuramoyl-L-alanine--D-glutamate ligase [Mangrovivirga cuniculi]QCK14556.1 UDP-N-acetylmuramoyl-L-alanine--D-glutamate ligase [Mangrovivirga cuniculi]